MFWSAQSAWLPPTPWCPVPAPCLAALFRSVIFLGSARPKTDALDKLVEDKLAGSLNNPATHLPQEVDKLIPQVIEAGALSSGEVMGAARDPAKICAAMLDKLNDPEHRRNDMQQAFERVLVPILTELLNDNAVCDLLRPAFETALAGSLAHIAFNVSGTYAPSRFQLDA